MVYLVIKFTQYPHIYSAIYNFYDDIRNFSSRHATSYVADVMRTYNWRAADSVGNSRCWILDASTLDSTLTARPEQLDPTDAVGTPS
jgi:surface antigen